MSSGEINVDKDNMALVKDLMRPGAFIGQNMSNG